MLEKDKKVFKIIGISIAAVFAFSMSIYVVQQKELVVKYDEAVALAEAGDYLNAKNIIGSIGEYKDSEELLERYTDEIDYQYAIQCVNEKKFDEALEILERLNSSKGGHKESREMQDQVDYSRAVELAKNGELSRAYEGFKRLPTSYLDVSERLTELTSAMKIEDRWFCKEYQIDMDIKAHISEENITYLDVEMRDRNGFLLDREDNKLNGTDLILMEDRFIWNLLGDETKYAVVLEDNKLKVAKHPIKDNNIIVTFVRKLNYYNSVDGDIDAAVHRKVDSGI